MNQKNVRLPRIGDGKLCYVAAKMKEANEQVRLLNGWLEDLGFTVAFDWVKNQTPKQAFVENRPEGRAAADKMIAAAFQAQVVVFIFHPEAKGAFIELGSALGSAIIQPDKRVYLVCTAEQVHYSDLFRASAARLVRTIDDVKFDIVSWEREELPVLVQAIG